MASQAQLDAARRNGALSRGPVTPEGKQKIAFNATRHGLTASTIVLTSESMERFLEVQQCYMDFYEPANEVEFALVEEIVASKWRIRRIWGFESAAIDLQVDVNAKAMKQEQVDALDGACHVAIAFRELSQDGKFLPLLNRYETRYARMAERALKQLKEMQAERRAAAPEPTAAPPETSPARREKIVPNEPDLPVEKPRDSPRIVEIHPAPLRK